ncbi:MAG: hypothetical protein KGL35_13810 [Bradyrhizobium sp.]|nr:hypothetical protein [Bradyrhizobium sp.]
MSAEARKLHALEAEPGRKVEPVGAAPGLGFSMQVDLGAGRVCTLQTFLPNDCTLPELNQMLDKMTAAGDRQRAHYQIEGLQRDLKQFRKEQEQGVEDLEKIKRDHQDAQLDRAGRIEKAGKALADFEKASLAVAEDRGRRNPGMTAQDKANAKRTQDGIDKLKAEIDVAEAEAAKALVEAQKVLDRRAELIAKTEAEIAHCERIVAAGLGG